MDILQNPAVLFDSPLYVLSAIIIHTIVACVLFETARRISNTKKASKVWGHIAGIWLIIAAGDAGLAFFSGHENALWVGILATFACFGSLAVFLELQNLR